MRQVYYVYFDLRMFYEVLHTKNLVIMKIFNLLTLWNRTIGGC